MDKAQSDPYVQFVCASRSWWLNSETRLRDDLRHLVLVVWPNCTRNTDVIYERTRAPIPSAYDWPPSTPILTNVTPRSFFCRTGITGLGRKNIGYTHNYMSVKNIAKCAMFDLGVCL